MTLRITLISLLLVLEGRSLEIDLRYDLDTGGFFNQPGAKEALRAAADFYEGIINDALGAIDHRNFYAGATWTPVYQDPLSSVPAQLAVPGQTKMIVPADTVIIFVGAANLGPVVSGKGGPGGVANLPSGQASNVMPWVNQVYNRGEPGALSFVVSGGNVVPSGNPVVDFAPWGGTIHFNSALANWNFSTTSATAAAGPDAISVALHEIGHVLGIGALVVQNSWTPLAQTGSFKGLLAKQSYGSEIQTDGTHLFSFSATSRTYGVFGRTHGSSQAPLMGGTLPTTSVFSAPTDLELAILRDIGWTLDLSQPEVSLSLTPAPRIRISSSTGMNYQIRRSTNLVTWSDMLVSPATGNGARLSWTDPNPATSGFYQVNAILPAAASGIAPSAARAAPVYGTEEVHPPGMSPFACECGAE